MFELKLTHRLCELENYETISWHVIGFALFRGLKLRMALVQAGHELQLGSQSQCMNWCDKSSDTKKSDMVHYLNCISRLSLLPLLEAQLHPSSSSYDLNQLHICCHWHLLCVVFPHMHIDREENTATDTEIYNRWQFSLTSPAFERHNLTVSTLLSIYLLPLWPSHCARNETQGCVSKRMLPIKLQSSVAQTEDT